jgi:hypothetical protein
MSYRLSVASEAAPTHRRPALRVLPGAVVHDPSPDWDHYFYSGKVRNVGTATERNVAVQLLRYDSLGRVFETGSSEVGVIPRGTTRPFVEIQQDFGPAQLVRWWTQIDPFSPEPQVAASTR